MNRMWATREKQIQKVLQNTSIMNGAIQGYLGNSAVSVETFGLEE